MGLWNICGASGYFCPVQFSGALRPAWHVAGDFGLCKRTQVLTAGVPLCTETSPINAAVGRLAVNGLDS